MLPNPSKRSVGSSAHFSWVFQRRVWADRQLVHALVPILVVAEASISACVRKNDAFTPQVEPVYDTTTGKLRLLQ